MKKLMFATALVASVAAFADATPTAINDDNAIGFNGYGLGATFNPGGGTLNYANGAAELDEEGNTKSAANGYFWFDGDSNSSVVTNEKPSTTKHTAFFASAEDTKYLALDTEGGTFWRSINTLATPTENTYYLGAAQAVAATGTYLDTLVQFTVTEDDAPTTTADDKLAIWLGVVTNAQGEVTGTNLMVRAKAWVLDGGQPAGITTDFVVANSPVEAGEWYRLTVKAVQTTIDPSSGFFIPAFQIYIDGNAVAATTSQISTEAQEAFTGNNLWLEGMASLATANLLFPSLAENIGQLADVTLQGVGFQGTGAVDEIVWTEDDLFPAGPSPIEFTLTWGEGVSTVQYVLSTDTTATNSLTSGTAVSLAPGDGTATIELIPEFASGYVFDKVTMGETELGLTFEIPSVSTNATLFAKVDAPAYPTYIDTTDATIKAKYDAWATKVNFDDSSASTHLNQFLLDVDEETTVGDTALEITEIKQNATAGWDITIGCSLDGVGLTGTVGETIVCNGYLAVSYTDDLTGTWTTENIAVTAVDSTTGTVTVNVNKSGAKFMKVSLKATQETVTP